MSNVKRMDIETVIRTVIKTNPAIKAKDLIAKVGDKTCRGRSTIYDHLKSMKLRGRIYSDRGQYYLEKPSKEKTSEKLGFFDWFKYSRESKKEEEKKREKERMAEFYATAEWAASVPEWGGMFKGLKDYADKLHKKRKELGLDE